MTQPPAIRSLGAPPDRHAERVVNDMLAWLHAGQTERWAKAKGAINSSQMGSVVGQQRAVARFAKIVGDLALRVELSPAKRGKYHLRLVSWIAFDPVRNDAVLPGEPLPPAAQLAVVVSYCSGANHRPQWNSGIPVVISRHAMIRCAQRKNVRTVNGLLLAVRELWDAAESVVLKMVADGVARSESGKTHADAWFAAIPSVGVRVPLSDGRIAVIAQASLLDKHTLIVKTVLSADDNNPEINFSGS
jgi:hypothetical protein